MLEKFINRNEELEYLESLYKTSKPQLIVIYGRRRIGKTELVKKFLEGKKGIYFFALKQPFEIEVQRLAENTSSSLNIYVKPDIFKIFEKIAETGRYVVVIDEFTYWIEEDPRVLTILQRIWDEILSKSKVFLILVASTYSLIEKSFSYGSALYGRRTGQWKLGPIEPKYVKDFLPNYSLEDLVYVYSSVGGVPFYLSLFDASKTFEENINRLFFNKGGVLYEEAENLLRFEVREPYVYLNIVNAIESGATTYSEIANKAKVNITNIAKYLKTLEDMGIIKREKPVMGRQRPIYRVIDYYIRFWVRYVLPNKDKIEFGTFKFEKKLLSNYIPNAFEDLVRDSIKHLYTKKKIPIAGRCSRYWEKEKEIDLVCLEGDKILALEVKWKTLKENEANKIIYNLKKKLDFREGYYGIVAKEIEGDIEGIKIELKDLFI